MLRSLSSETGVSKKSSAPESMPFITSAGPLELLIKTSGRPSAFAPVSNRWLEATAESKHDTCRKYFKRSIATLKGAEHYEPINSPVPGELSGTSRGRRRRHPLFRRLDRRTCVRHRAAIAALGAHLYCRYTREVPLPE